MNNSIADSLIDKLWKKIPEKFQPITSVFILILIISIPIYFSQQSKDKATGHIDLKNTKISGSALLNTGNISINYGPEPKIIEQKIVSSNIPFKGKYKQEIEIRISNQPQQGFKLNIDQPKNTSVIANPIFIGSSLGFSQTGTIPYATYKLQLLTVDKIISTNDLKLSFQ